MVTPPPALCLGGSGVGGVTTPHCAGHEEEEEAKESFNISGPCGFFARFVPYAFGIIDFKPLVIAKTQPLSTLQPHLSSLGESLTLNRELSWKIDFVNEHKDFVGNESTLVDWDTFTTVFNLQITPRTMPLLKTLQCSFVSLTSNLLAYHQGTVSLQKCFLIIKASYDQRLEKMRLVQSQNPLDTKFPCLVSLTFSCRMMKFHLALLDPMQIQQCIHIVIRYYQYSPKLSAKLQAFQDLWKASCRLVLYWNMLDCVLDCNILQVKEEEKFQPLLCQNLSYMLVLKRTFSTDISWRCECEVLYCCDQTSSLHPSA
ncbi:hypothetical protein Tco_0657764 [Tanacetum coccineum]